MSDGQGDYYSDLHDDYFSEPVGSCEACGGNIYPDEDDGSDLCDQCQWYAEHAASQSNEDVL